MSPRFFRCDHVPEFIQTPPIARIERVPALILSHANMQQIFTPPNGLLCQDGAEDHGTPSPPATSQMRGQGLYKKCHRKRGSYRARPTIAVRQNVPTVLLTHLTAVDHAVRYIRGKHFAGNLASGDTGHPPAGRETDNGDCLASSSSPQIIPVGKAS